MHPVTVTLNVNPLIYALRIAALSRGIRTEIIEKGYHHFRYLPVGTSRVTETRYLAFSAATQHKPLSQNASLILTMGVFRPGTMPQAFRSAVGFPRYGNSRHGKSFALNRLPARYLGSTGIPSVRPHADCRPPRPIALWLAAAGIVSQRQLDC